MCEQLAASLVQDVPEPAGASCATGGEVIEVGDDRDGDGQLERSEATDRAYVCDDSDTRVAVAPEPPGARCPDGGQRIYVGLDANGDDLLEPSEASTTLVACGVAMLPPVIDGDYIVRNAYSAALLDGVTTVTRGVTIEARTPRIHLPTLETIGGTLACGLARGCPQTLLDAPALQHANLQLSSTNGGLPSELDLPSWQGGELDLVSFTLDDLSLPSFREGDINLNDSAVNAVDLPAYSHGTFYAWEEAALATVSLPAFTSGTVYIWYDYALQSVDVPALASGTISLAGNPVLTSIRAPMLASADFELWDTPQVQSVELPSLASASEFLFVNDPGLATVSAPVLTAAQDFEFVLDPGFPTCAAQQLAIQCAASTPRIFDTDDAATCP